MELEELIAEVLQRGADKSLDELTSSKRFAKTQKEHKTYLPALLQGTGEMLVAAALGCLPEDIAELALAIQACEGEDQVTLIHYAFSLFRKAEKKGQKVKKSNNIVGVGSWEINPKGYVGSVTVTPKDFRVIAQYYKDNGDPKTAELLLFASSWGTEVCGISGDNLPEWMKIVANRLVDYYEDQSQWGAEYEWMPSILDYPYPVQRVLPGEYGVLGDSPVVPNCLGMSIMLVAFGRLAGLPTMLVNPIMLSEDAILRTNGTLATLTIEHLDTLGYTSQSEFREALVNHKKYVKSYEQRVSDFHYSVALQVSNGDWVHLDPFLNRVGVFTDGWQLTDTYSTLQEHKTSQPGLTIVRDDAGELARWLDKHIAERLEAFEEVEHLSQYISEMPFALEHLVDIAEGDYKVDTEYADLLYVVEQLAETMSADGLYDKTVTLFDPVTRVKVDEFGKIAHFLDMIAGQVVDAEDEVLYSERWNAYMDIFLDDVEWRNTQLEKVFMSLVGLAMDKYSDLLTEQENLLLDPAMQFCLPEYNLALAVANHVRCWTNSDVSGRVFLDLSSSQVYWHEAVDLSKGYCQSDADHPKVLQAEAMVRNLSHIHPAVQKKLEYLTRARQRG